jgi:membrane associated rhomboid family serine protease
MLPLKDDHPLHHFPLITVVLLGLNVFIFIRQADLVGEQKYEFWYKYGSIPWEIVHNTDQEPLIDFSVRWTLITHMFLHADWLHLIGNMLYLWIFAKGVEDAMGYPRFIVFYLLCGVMASLSHIATAPDSPIPGIGASGAISGMLGAYFVLLPTANILTVFVLPGTLIRVIPVPAFLFLGPWIILQVIRGTYSLQVSGRGGVAWFAHIGGFAAGLVFAKLFEKS